MQKNILCFGDSNTWGYIPGTGERYAPDIRWPGVLAAALGAGYHISEDGLNGRTTGFDFPWADCRNGQSGLPYALLSQRPLDLLIISLGINDLNVVDAAFSARSAAGLIRRTRMLQAVPDACTRIFRDETRILIVAPAPVLPDFDQRFNQVYYAESCLLADRYREMAEENGVEYLNAGDYAVASPVDCVHYTPESHRNLGLAIARKVREMLGD